MSVPQTPPGSAATPETQGQDPSMEDILASIRRILNEQQPPARLDTPREPPEAHTRDDVLMLDRSMIVPGEEPEPAEVPSTAPANASSATLLVPEATVAAATADGKVPHRVAAQRTLQIHGGGPTVEDIVREEVRPLLKQWLDANLPDLVERLMRAEIERIVRRAIP